MLKLERARELFAFDAETGELTWRISRGKARTGKRAGYLSESDRYRRVQIDGKMYLEHVVIWLICHGSLPHRQIDHIDRNRSNNRRSNLRLATASQNRANAKIRCDNTTGYRGVSFHKQAQKFHARIYANGCKRSIGLFSTAEEAGEAARLARVRTFGCFAPNYDQRERQL